jgi:hypothetical protein
MNLFVVNEIFDFPRLEKSALILSLGLVKRRKRDFVRSLLYVE